MPIVASPWDLAKDMLLLRGRPFDLDSYPYMKRIYESDASEIGLFFGRQTAKSTSLASMLTMASVMYEKGTHMFVAPLQDQAEVFATQRLRDFIHDSPMIKHNFFTGTGVIDQVFRKMFNNGSMISCGYAQRTADRLRGRSLQSGFDALGNPGPAYLVHDEVQDIFPEVFPVIREMGFRTKRPIYLYGGTPKSYSNNMESFRARSTSCEWAVKCPEMGCGKWNLKWTEVNVGNTGVICEHCGRPLNTDQGQWVARRAIDTHLGKDAKVTMESYRVSQLMVRPVMTNPSGWADLLTKVRGYSSELLNNEVWGLPFDSAAQPVTPAQLAACCNPNRANVLPKPSDNLPPLVMGVDWAFVGNDSYTVVVIGAWDSFPNKFKIYYYRVFKGSELDPLYQIQVISDLFRDSGCQIAGVDWGCGQVQNISLMNNLGAEHVMQMYHAGNMGAGAARAPRMKYNKETLKWHLARTRVLTDTFEGVRRRQIEFPRFEDCDVLFDHFLAEHMEYRATTNSLHYCNIKPDDLLHATTYAMLAGEFYLQGNYQGHGGQAAPVPGSIHSLASIDPDPWAMEPGEVDNIYA